MTLIVLISSLLNISKDFHIFWVNHISKKFEINDSEFLTLR